MILQLSLPIPLHENSANSPAQHDREEERVAGRMLKITRGILSSLILLADLSNMVKTPGLSQVNRELSHLLSLAARWDSTNHSGSFYLTSVMSVLIQ